MADQNKAEGVNVEDFLSTAGPQGGQWRPRDKADVQTETNR
jgi:hypothetical protein